MKSYDAPASNSMVVRLFVLERGGISLDVKTVDVMNMENRGLEYRKINPRGEVPALILDNGFVLTEVTAICEYLDEIAQGGKTLFGETPLERAETHMWLRRMDLEIAQYVISWVRNDPGTADFYIGHRIPIPEARLAQKVIIQQYLNLLDEQLEGKKYLCGERFSAADTHFYSLMKGKTMGMAPWMLHPGRKNVVNYFKRMDARRLARRPWRSLRPELKLSRRVRWNDLEWMFKPLKGKYMRVETYIRDLTDDDLDDRNSTSNIKKAQEILEISCDSVRRGAKETLNILY